MLLLILVLHIGTLQHLIIAVVTYGYETDDDDYYPHPRAGEVFKELELSRVEIIGGNKYKGAKKNITSHLEQKSRF